MATMHELSQIEVFVRVVADGGFTSAAKHLGVSKSFASRQIGQLEDRLAARLLNRTTRKLTLTDVGTEFYNRCHQIMEDLTDAESAVTSLQTSPRGTLRLAVPMSFGLKYVMPALSDFLATHRDLVVEMDMADRRVDLVDEGFDLAVRIGNLPDSTLVARKLAETAMHLCASKAYLAAHGRPKQPSDLRDHDCLIYSYQARTNWHLVGPQGELTIPVRPRLVTNNGDALAQAACAGHGIALLPDFIVTELLRDGRLAPVLPKWGDSTTIWAVFPHNRHLSAKVRLFVEFLANRWSTPPWRALLRAGPDGRRRRASAGH